MLDANILIAALKGEPVALLNRLATLAHSRICLSSIVLAELLTGAEKSRKNKAIEASAWVTSSPRSAACSRKKPVKYAVAGYGVLS